GGLAAILDEQAHLVEPAMPDVPGVRRPADPLEAVVAAVRGDEPEDALAVDLELVEGGREIEPGDVDAREDRGEGRHAGATDIDGARAIDGRGVEAVVVAEAEVPATQGRA